MRRVPVPSRSWYGPSTRRSAADGSAALPATVDNAVYVGTDTQYHLRLASGAPFVVRCQNTRADVGVYEPGDRLSVLLGDHAVQVLRD